MTELTLFDTAISLAPLAIGLVIYYWYSLNTRELAIASARMVLQLVTIGYLLTFLFKYDWPWLGLGIMSVMLIAATFISIRPLQHKGNVNIFDRVRWNGKNYCITSITKDLTEESSEVELKEIFS